MNCVGVETNLRSPLPSETMEHGIMETIKWLTTNHRHPVTTLRCTNDQVHNKRFDNSQLFSTRATQGLVIAIHSETAQVQSHLDSGESFRHEGDGIFGVHQQRIQMHHQECPIRLGKFSRKRNYSISKTATAELGRARLACSSINTCAASRDPISAASAVANCG